jgi:serine/threonine-protein kinase
VTDQLGDRGVALSPDGRDLVYIGWRGGTSQLYRRSMDQLDASPIQGTEGARAPFFSPDGEWVGFYAENELRKVSLAGGTPVTLCDAEPRYGADWGSDDTITFEAGAYSALMRVPAAGGTPQQITAVNADQGEVHHCLPDLLPGDKAMLFTVRYSSPEIDRLAVQALETGERKMLVDGTNPRYAPTGHIVFAKEQSLWAVPFDADRLEVTGSPTPVLDGILVHWSGLASFALAGDGSLVYVPEVDTGSERELVWVDREGRTTPVVADRRGNVAWPRLSPDGRQLTVYDEQDVWVYDVERGTRTRFTFEGSNFNAVWTPDGKRIAFSSTRTGYANIYWKRADGSGAAEQLVTGGYSQQAQSWSPNGELLAFSELNEGQRDIWMLPLEGDRVPMPFIVSPFNEQSPSFSPDGRWLAYVSDESGRDEVYVQPYPGPGRKVPISTDGGRQPVWCADGGELYYRSADRMIVVPIETQPTLEVGTPQVLFEGRYLAGPSADYDVSPDCQKFVMISPVEGTMTQLNVVLNWFEELKRVVPKE